jgi:hypothetical protein
MSAIPALQLPMQCINLVFLDRLLVLCSVRVVF